MTSLRLMSSICVWDISNFYSKCQKYGDYIDSPDFAAGNIPSNKIKWFLRLYPFGDSIQSNSYVSIFLCSKFCSDITEIEVSYKIHLWYNQERNMYSNTAYPRTFVSKIFNKKNYSWGYSTFLQRNGSELNYHLSSSTNKTTLSIACYISSSYSDDNLNFYEELITGHSNFFLSKMLSDVTIEVERKKLKAHKVILSARSEVFQAMFSHNMAENNTNLIKITDVSYDVMKEVLRFIYCGKVEKLDLYHRDLLAAADKYGLHSLKKLCEQRLIKDLNTNNACEILNISHLYQCAKIKEKIIDFIIKNMKAVVDSEGFKEIKDCSVLADILRQNAQKVAV